MFKSYFQFTRKERNGILFLISIIVLVWVIYISVDFFFKPNPLDYSRFEKQIDLFYASMNDTKSIPKKNIAYNKDTCIIDVNSPQIDLLHCIGINDHLANTWINFTKKGGTFKTIEEVKKLWGMNDSIFNTIAPYLTLCKNESKEINSTFSNKTWQNTKKSEKKVEMIEINTADTIELKKLPGIGKSFALRIVKYRNRLGGFYAKEQLMEIYGFKQELFDKISPYIYVDVFEIKKININTSDYSTLIQNPYFTKEAVKTILQYRKNYGKFNNGNDLLIHQIINEDEWSKLKWYIDF